jgi:beta-galactosidase
MARSWFLSGLLDLAGNIKPLGYFRKSLWSEEPMAYIGTSKYVESTSGTGRGNRLSTNAPPVWNYDKIQKFK